MKFSLQFPCGSETHRIVIDTTALTAEMFDHPESYERWLAVHELGGNVPACFHCCHNFMELTSEWREMGDKGARNFAEWIRDIADLMLDKANNPETSKEIVKG